MTQKAADKDPGSGLVYTYNTQWDAQKIRGCTCDKGFFGPTCTQRRCARGDDPLTGTPSGPPIQVNAVQMLVCNASLSMAQGSFMLGFKKTFTTAIYPSDTLAVFQAKLAALSTISDGGVYITGTSSTVCAGPKPGAVTRIEFTQDFGTLPLLVTNTAYFKGTVRVFQKVAGTKENADCSNRGICDYATGLCICNVGYDNSDGEGNEGTRPDCGYPSLTITDCPGVLSCNQKGACSGYAQGFVCTCGQGWMGSDCTLRSCAIGRTWYAFPTANEVAHNNYVECGGMGYCQRSDGVCSCAPGFGGAACQIMLCPGSNGPCNNNGRCIPIGEAALEAKTNGVSTPYTYGATPNNPATWDARKVFGCMCDKGYTGYDCSQRLCPFGDDPITPGVNEIQNVTCKGTSGSFTLTFRSMTTSPISWSASPVAVKAALEALTTIERVNVTSKNSTVCTRRGNFFMVTFYVPTGNLPQMVVTAASTLVMNVTTSQQGTKEWAECSNRGICDRITGICQCFEGMATSDGQGHMGQRGDCGFKSKYLAIAQ